MSSLSLNTFTQTNRPTYSGLYHQMPVTHVHFVTFQPLVRNKHITLYENLSCHFLLLSKCLQCIFTLMLYAISLLITAQGHILL